MQLIKKDPNANLVFSSVDGDEIPFTIGDSAVIISILRDKIYSNPKQTMICEYLSNARDSNVEAGTSPGAIDVQLPTSQDPTFSCRDYGVGLSDDRVREVFTAYGNSTKRKSVSQLGSFGLGGKLAYAYTDSFTITSFYNGMQTIYIADIGTNKEGRLIVASQDKTKEPNGVKISIPIQSQHFSDIIHAYIRTVWLWNDRPKSNLDKGIKFPKVKLALPNTVIWDISGTGMSAGFYLDAAGIPYDHKLSYEQQRNFPHFYDYAISVRAVPIKMGIAANREEFSAKSYADSLVKQAHKEIVDYVQTTLDKEPLENLIDTYKDFCKKNLHDHMNNYLKTRKFYHFTSRGEISLASTCLCSFLKIEEGKGVVKSLERHISIPDSTMNVFSSSFLTPVEDYQKMPKATKNTISHSRKLIKEKKLTHPDIVVFQHQGTPEHYEELCKVLNTKSDIEDAYTQKKTRQKSTLPAAQVLAPKDFQVSPWKEGRTHYSVVKADAKDLSEYTSQTTPWHIFYSTDPDRPAYKAIEALRYFKKAPIKVAYVYANKVTQEFLAKQSYASPVTSLKDWVKANPYYARQLGLSKDREQDSDLFDYLYKHRKHFSFKDHDLKALYKDYSEEADTYYIRQQISYFEIQESQAFKAIREEFPLLGSLSCSYMGEPETTDVQLYINARQIYNQTLKGAKNDTSSPCDAKVDDSNLQQKDTGDQPF